MVVKSLRISSSILYFFNLNADRCSVSSYTINGGFWTAIVRLIPKTRFKDKDTTLNIART